MLIRSMREVEAAGKLIVINHGEASACRVLLKADGAGFSVSEARMKTGSVANLWYKNHWEANYVRSGTATLEDIVGGRQWTLKTGDLYLVGPTDKHRMTALSQEVFRVVSVFNPPIAGNETHDADNSYAASGPVPPRKDPMLVRTPADVKAAGHTSEFAAKTGRIAHIITKADGVGFSYSDVHLARGHRSDHTHKHHTMASLVLEGNLEVTDKDGKTHTLSDGDLYCVGPGETHSLHAIGDTHMISVFNPPLVGTERLDATGGYPIS
ncbi:MAG: ectoine synthase [Hyphomicrobiaceae bacterium]